MAIKRPKEGGLTAPCLHLLALMGCFAWRQNAGAFVAPQTATTARRFVRFVSAEADGISDIVGVLPKTADHPGGRFLAVELKRPGGRTEKRRAARQAAFRSRVTAIGGLAIVVRSVGELKAALEAEGY